MIIEKIAQIENCRQDGLIWNGYFFSFTSKGKVQAFKMSDIDNPEIETPEVFSEFYLDQSKDLIPHNNAVTFGKEYYSPEDEYPLIYTNVYNNYYAQGNQLQGVCCVYRLWQTEGGFETELVQLIEIGFTKDSKLWSSSPECDDVRPYGNFVVDRDNGIFYAFTMRDKLNTTRYFAFDLPKVTDGEMDETYGVKKVVLNPADIKEYFDCPYHHYMQGACVHEGKIYSLEGFTNTPSALPVLRIIDPEAKKEIAYINFSDYGMNIETELIDFYNGKCYYMDDEGAIYNLIF
ncbi:MAG: hypothetical protein IJE44_04345 [Clostridia bacterium]|nr:hypothetical protein [Clostridia bacterium]